MATAPDVYFKKIINYKYCKKALQFRVSQDLFSSFQIDIGTQFLLRTITPDGSSNFRSILDLGCGYGPIGMTLKALNTESRVCMVDSDALAIEYSRQNAELNNLTGVEVYGSLDYDNVKERDFDLIVSNLPAKAGEPVIAHMLLDASRYLAPDGRVVVVVITALASKVADILTGTPDIEIIAEKSRRGHMVFSYRFKTQTETPPQNQDEDAYYRGKFPFENDNLRYTLDMAYGIQEFERTSYHTGLLIDGLKKIANKNINRVLVYNPGVGHIPVAAWKLLQPQKITLVDRNLLALKYSGKNLILNGCPASCLAVEHGVAIGNQSGYDVAAGILREEEGVEPVWQTFMQLTEGLRDHGIILLAGSSTAITRIITRLPEKTTVKIRERTKYRGFSLLVLESVRDKQPQMA